MTSKDIFELQIGIVAFLLTGFFVDWKIMVSILITAVIAFVKMLIMERKHGNDVWNVTHDVTEEDVLQYIHYLIRVFIDFFIVYYVLTRFV